MVSASQPSSWQGEAFNEVPESENLIHGDEIAKRHGFTGGLVPGVTVSAYLMHPAVEAWGMDWLTRGQAKAVVKQPLYDAERFDVEVKPDPDPDPNSRADRYEATLYNGSGKLCAQGTASLPAVAPEPPAFRGDPKRTRGMERPTASREVFERLREQGLMAVRSRWSHDSELTSYTRDPSHMAGPCRPANGYAASPAYVLGMTNWALAANVFMPAWLHLQTEHQNFAPIPLGSELITELAVADLFERKGHEFVDVELSTFMTDETPVASCRLRAIYRLRGS